ncbi:hypothetical protein OEA41_007952 [Lepraria neglecta]|uniref:Uncharacterized protein n=1 Tax=Lepraria neglecta TaxID=209136 RepID=A0AAD9ZGI1_9LECA|nr:hypothetical protein OEA41_007952 [Lepraria neglecta]
MSRHDRAGGRHPPPRRNDPNDNSDDDVPRHLIPPRFWTDREFRRRIINAINMELHNYEGHYHLDDSFYNYTDIRGRGSRVRDEGADRPTPPEMGRILASLIARRTLSNQDASAVMKMFCDAIPDEHPFFARYGLEAIEAATVMEVIASTVDHTAMVDLIPTIP